MPALPFPSTKRAQFSPPPNPAPAEPSLHPTQFSPVPPSGPPPSSASLRPFQFALSFSLTDSFNAALACCCPSSAAQPDRSPLDAATNARLPLPRTPLHRTPLPSRLSELDSNTDNACRLSHTNPSSRPTRQAALAAPVCPSCVCTVPIIPPTHPHTPHPTHRAGKSPARHLCQASVTIWRTCACSRSNTAELLAGRPCLRRREAWPASAVTGLASETAVAEKGAQHTTWPHHNNVEFHSWQTSRPTSRLVNKASCGNQRQHWPCTKPVAPPSSAGASASVSMRTAVSVGQLSR